MYKKLLIILGIITLTCLNSNAQFKEKAFSQSYNSKSDSLGRDSTDKLFSIKEYFNALQHKQTYPIGAIFAGSTIFMGGQQIYNKQYWKLPLVYSSIGSTLAAGFIFRSKWQTTGQENYHTLSNVMFGASALCYWAMLMDGVINFPDDKYPQPGKATLYSILCPGLGQIYNKEYWKIPLYYTGLISSLHFMLLNNRNYVKYRDLYNEATTNKNYQEPISAETALHYRNTYRRMRDYSIVAILGFYLLQVIDANVFAYMHNFEISDDLSVDIEPTIINPNPVEIKPNISGLNYPTTFGNQFASTNIGLKIGFRF